MTATSGGVSEAIDAFSADEFIITFGAAITGTVTFTISGLQLPTFVDKTTGKFNYKLNANAYSDYQGKIVKSKANVPI